MKGLPEAALKVELYTPMYLVSMLTSCTAFVFPDGKSSRSLEFLLSKGLHSHATSFFLAREQEDSLEAHMLYPHSANYMCTYCTTYPQHVLSQHQVCEDIINRLTTVLTTTTTFEWTQQRASKPDLKVLASLPRQLLISNGPGRSLLSLLPVQHGNTDVLDALAAIFHGPKDTPLTRESPNKTLASEGAFAREIYLTYSRQTPDLHQHIIQAADDTNDKAKAIAALNLVSAILTANWPPVPAPSTTNGDVPMTNGQTHAFDNNDGAPSLATGLDILLDEPSRSTLLPYLLSLPRPVAHQASADEISRAREIAYAKFGILKVLKENLERAVQGNGREEWRSWWEMARDRVSVGAWPSVRFQGRSVGTLEG